MKAPRLNTRLTLEVKIAVPDGAGGEVDVWVAVAEHHAALTARNASEGEAGAKRFAEISYRATMRYADHASPKRPRPDQRFRDGDRIFNILGVADADDRRQWMTCWLQEGAPS